MLVFHAALLPFPQVFSIVSHRNTDKDVRKHEDDVHLIALCKVQDPSVKY